MPAHFPDLDAYFARIGYTGSREPSAATLTAIHQHHARAIPFENLDVLLGRPISLEPAAIERKLVHDRRGGYCFEQNALLRDVLRALGFRVTPLIGRVRWQVPAARSAWSPPRSSENSCMTVVAVIASNKTRCCATCSGLSVSASRP